LTNFAETKLEKIVLNKFEHCGGLLHNCRGMKKLFGVLLGIFTAVVLFGATAWAASANGAADINDLMGQRPSSSFYQNPTSGSQTQGSSSSTGSAAASVLQQPATGELKVIAPSVTTTPAAKTKSSSWEWPATLAVIFFVAAIALLVLTLNARESVKQIVAQELPKVKEVIAKKVAPAPKKATANAKKSSNKKRKTKARR
jgi:predicted PurR-regulated permease PerM